MKLGPAIILSIVVNMITVFTFNKFSPMNHAVLGRVNQSKQYKWRTVYPHDQTLFDMSAAVI